MFILKINRQKCDKCLECQKVLPGILSKFVANEFFISDSKFRIEKDRINGAISMCKSGALTWEETNV